MSYLQTKYEDAKTFVTKYKVPLACGTGFVIGYAITRDMRVLSKAQLAGMTQQLNKLIEQDTMDDMNHLTLLEFVDYKNLANEFVEFSKMQNGVEDNSEAFNEAVQAAFEVLQRSHAA